MESSLLFGLLGLAAVVCIYLGARCRSESSDLVDYFLGGRQLGPIALMLTLVATQVGGGTILGAAEQAYQQGWVVLFYPLGVSLGFLLLGVGVGSALRKRKLLTVVELFETVYGSPRLRRFASALSIVSLFIVLVGLGIAARQFFLSIGIASTWVYLIFWAVVITYTVMGGLQAVVNTDIAQTLFILLTFAIAAWVGLNADTGAAEAVNIATSTAPVPWVDWMIMPLLFMLIEQDMGQRCFAAKSPRAISLAALGAAVVLMACCSIPIAFGVKARAMGLEVGPGENILLKTVGVLCGPYISAAFNCAVLLAVVSTADSLLCSVSSNLACDFPRIRAAGGKGAKLCTALVGGSAALLSFLFTDVIALFIIAYELSVSVVAVPLVMALIVPRPTRRAAIASMTAGGLGLMMSKCWAMPVPGILVTLAMSCVAYGLANSKKNYVPAT